MLNRKWLADTAERTGLTAVEAFAASLILAGTNVLSLSAVHSAEVAAVGAGLAVLKAAIATLVPSSVSPASLVPGPSAQPLPPVPVTSDPKK